VRAADFTRLTRSGQYYLESPEIARVGSSPSARKVYSRAWYLAMRRITGSGCGHGGRPGPESPGYKHDACHLEGAYHASSGKDGASFVQGRLARCGRLRALRWSNSRPSPRGTLLWTWGAVWPHRLSITSSSTCPEIRERHAGHPQRDPLEPRFVLAADARRGRLAQADQRAVSGRVPVMPEKDQLVST